MAQLRHDYQEYKARNAEIIIVGPENKESFSRHWHREELPFLGIPDPEHKIADLFGQQVKLLKFGRLPALVVVDKQGLVQYRHYGGSMRDIPKNSEILTKLDELND